MMRATNIRLQIGEIRKGNSDEKRGTGSPNK
jgi:hypothetical protein